MRIARGILVGGATALVLGCSEGGTGPGPGPGTTFMSANIDGVAWAAEAAYITGIQSTIAGSYVIQGSKLSGTNAVTVGLTLMNISGPGTYPLGTGANVAGGSGVVVNAPQSWGTLLSGAAGTVTITTLTANRIAGTFNFTAHPQGTAGSPQVVTTGKFDTPLTLLGNPGPVPDWAASKVSAKLNGEDWNAATLAIQPNPDQVFGFSGSNTRFALSIAIADIGGPGTYEVGSAIGNAVIFVGGTGEGAGPCCWASVAGSVGTVTVLTRTATRATGTFSLTLPPQGGGATVPMVVTNGTFDLGLKPLP